MSLFVEKKWTGADRCRYYVHTPLGIDLMAHRGEQMTATNQKAVKAGKEDARTFYAENTTSDVLATLQPGQLAPSDSLVSSMATGWVLRSFGLKRAGTAAHSSALADYDRAYLKELAHLLAEGDE